MLPIASYNYPEMTDRNRKVAIAHLLRSHGNQRDFWIWNPYLN